LNSKPITHTDKHTYTQYTSKKNTQTQSKAKRDKKHILGATNRQQKGGREGRRGEVENQVMKRFYILSASQLLCAMAKKKSRENEVPQHTAAMTRRS
jgi:hypothetical protein